MQKDNIKVKKIAIKSKRAVFTEVVGNNASIFLGEGYDFAELREYQMGDDIRHIDWIISAKLQKPFVKLFHAEREISVVCASVLGGSVYFGTHRQKQELIAEIVAIIGFSAIKNGDPFSNYIFAEKLHSIIRPTKRLPSVQDAIGEILEFSSLGKDGNYGLACKLLFERLKRRSLLFVIGDFISEGIDFRVLSKKHEAVAIIVRDRLEEEPFAFGHIELLDPQNGKSMSGFVNETTIKAYVKELKSRDMKLYEHLKSCRVRFVKIYTDEEPFVKLLKLFGKK